MRMLLAWGLLLSPLIAFADAAETARRLDELYELRHQPERLKELEAQTSQALKTHPEDGGILWRAARLKYWQCDGITHPAMRKRWERPRGITASARSIKTPLDRDFFAVCVLRHCTCECCSPGGYCSLR